MKTPLSQCSVAADHPDGRLEISSTVVAVKDQISADLDGERVILLLSKGIYYGLDAVGVRVWELLQVPRKVGRIRDRLVEEYEVQPEQCEKDLFRLLERLVSEKLIGVRNGPGV